MQNAPSNFERYCESEKDTAMDDGAHTMNNLSSDMTPAANGLKDHLREIAQRELGETEDVKRQALQELRELIAGEPLLHCSTEEAFLIMFLRARKYDALQAFKNIKRLFDAKRNNPEMFDVLDPYHIPFDAACRKNRLTTISRGRDPEGRYAVLVRLGAWNTDICPLTDFFRVGLVNILQFVQNEEAQIRGHVVVIDMAGLGPYHLLHYTPSVIRTYIALVQDSAPMRIKGVYVINHPAIFSVLFTVAKPFMKSKLVKRIRLLGYDVDKLRGLVPDDLIPEQYGGTHESYDYDEYERQLKTAQKFFEEFNSYGYQKTTMNAT